MRHFLDEVRRTHSTTQINLPGELAARVVAWGYESVPDDLLYSDPDNLTFGREWEPHVTLFNLIKTDDHRKVKSFFGGLRPFEINLGKISLFTTNSHFDVVKIDVDADELHRLYGDFKAEFSPWTKRDYVPHVTIAYVRKGYADRFRADGYFCGEKFLADEVVFSNTRSDTKTIKLGKL